MSSVDLFLMSLYLYLYSTGIMWASLGGSLAAPDPHLARRVRTEAPEVPDPPTHQTNTTTTTTATTTTTTATTTTTTATATTNKNSNNTSSSNK